MVISLSTGRGSLLTRYASCSSELSFPHLDCACDNRVIAKEGILAKFCTFL
jgi:hypothetical protein